MTVAARPPVSADTHGSVINDTINTGHSVPKTQRKECNVPNPTEIQLITDPPQLNQTDFTGAVISAKKQYQSQLSDWQTQLLRVQQAYYHQSKRAIIIFEGWDASGKGGTIRRITEKLDPRGFRVYPTGAPTAEEQSRHYLYRFQKHLPPSGRLVIFDRSYYGRVLVERIEGFAKPVEWQRAFQEINEFERLLADDGVRIVKLFLHISPEEQLSRFEERLNNPDKRWKLTLEDIRNRERWADYELAINDMFHKTSTHQAPWHLIAANHKWYTRVAALKLLVQALSKDVDISPPAVDPAVIAAAKAQLGIGHQFSEDD